MRKILLGTTAVVGAALFGAGSAQAQQAPTLRIGGYFEFNAAYINDTMDSFRTIQAGPGVTPALLGTQVPGTPFNQPGARRRDRYDFRQGDTEIHLFVTGKAANGLSYGFTMELQFDNATTQGSGTVIDTDEAYAFLSSPTLGTLRLGDEDSAASLMQTRLPTVTGLGPDNMWDEFVARSPDGQAPYLISGINDGSDATKIIYLSPQFFGFDFGVSFAANGREGEAWNSVASPSTGAGTGAGTAILQRDVFDSLRNELAGAVRYRGSFGGVGVAASFGAQRADAQRVVGTGLTAPGTAGNPNLQDISAYHAGVNFTAFGLTFGGEYNWGKYGGASTARTPIRRGLGASDNWAVGVTYTIAGVALGGFYGQGTRDNGAVLADREQTVWGIGAAYTLAPGLELVANYTNVKDRNLANNASNPTFIALGRRDVDIFIVGTRIAF
jgi:predicted porin